MDLPPQPDLQLPFEIYHQLVHTLRATLPPPITDTPEELARRDRTAIAQVAALVPANADEANLGAQYVAAGARAMDRLRLVREHADDVKLVRQAEHADGPVWFTGRGPRT